jgi:predicted transcriptional regulator
MSPRPVAKHRGLRDPLHRNCNALERVMKSATFPSLRVDPALRKAAEEVLLYGESLSSFVEQSVRDQIERRRAQEEFIARGLAARDKARRADNHVSSAIVLKNLKSRLAKAKRKIGAKKSV